EEAVAQYADYALWQREWLQGELLREQVHYWKGQLAGLEPLQLPIDGTQSIAAAKGSAHYMFRLDRGLTDRLKQLGRHEGATLFITLFSAFFTVMAHYTGQEDMVIATDVANRNHRETEHLMGFLANQLPLRMSSRGKTTFKELLRAVRIHFFESLSYQDVPFQKIVEELAPGRSMQDPLVRIKLVLQNAALDLRVEGLKMELLDIVPAASKFDLLLTCFEDHNGIAAGFEGRRSLFSPAVLEFLASQWKQVLEDVSAQPDIGLQAISEKLHGLKNENFAARQMKSRQAIFDKLQSARRKQNSLA
ncbi:MAG: non-ribosomal peptide synthetase, partial [Acidobacteriia bacterium]|nr:non-ribosomal peptide synthetase [Terriglobia bacterium]